MAIACPHCATENSPSASFCKKCGNMLPRIKAQPDAPAPVAAIAADTREPGPPLPDAEPEPAVAPALTPIPAPAIRGGDKVVAIVGAVIALLAVAASGSYWWMNRHAFERIAPAAVTRPAPAPVPAAPPMAAPAVPAPPMPAPPPEQPVARPPLGPTPPVVVAPPPAATTPRPPLPLPAPRAVPAQPAPEPNLPLPTPRASPQQVPLAPQPAAPEGPASPREACGSRVFLALARCMAEQCESPQFRSHSQCVQLREENRRREEAARNPTG